MRFLLGTLCVIVFAAWSWPALVVTPTPSSLPGWPLYDRLCSACHGADGDGRGPAAPYSTGTPRSFVAATYKWTTVQIGGAPTDEDLALTIRHGAPGTSMPAFALSDVEISRLVDVVKAFAPEAFATPGTRTRATAITDAPTIGAEVWRRAGCIACHGELGRGAGTTPPYDLTTQPVHRPRASDRITDRRAAIVQSIATGIAGTPMPGYLGTLTDAEMSAVADHVIALGAAVRPRDKSQLDAASIRADRTAKLVAGTWPGRGPEAVVFGAPVPPQGPPPATLAPAQASLGARQCGRCHAKQVREWTGSVHAGAASPGLRAQIDYALGKPAAASCRRCHTPLAEQATDLALRAEGIQCAGCHVREWKRHGPPNVAPSLLPLPGYPLQTLALYERADFCMTCHQLPPRVAVNGKPLLNTYKEWLEGPYMPRGVQCQHCHMPNREHTFLGIHDPTTFRQGIALTTQALRTDGTTTVSVDLANVGAGHSLPTTPTPAVYVTLELIDRDGVVLRGASVTHTIGRSLAYDGDWKELADTRIAPGAHASFVKAWRDDGRAASARVTVTVHPDALYERIYTERLATKLVPAQITLYREALATAIKRRYVAEERVLPLP